MKQLSTPLCLRIYKRANPGQHFSFNSLISVAPFMSLDIFLKHRDCSSPTRSTLFAVQ